MYGIDKGMKEDKTNRTYDNQHLVVELFSEQSENCEVLIGKVQLRARKPMHPLKMLLELRGYYKIYDIPKKDAHNSTESHIDITETMSEFENVATRRIDKPPPDHEYLEREECFLEGAQRISIIDEDKMIEADQLVTYPFLFNLPANTPPSLDALWFAHKRIEIRYFLTLKGTAGEEQEKDKEFKTEFEISLREPVVGRPDNKFCKVMQYRCFSRFFCRCLGTYHVELSASVLHVGQLQVEGRVFREGKKTDKIINCINVVLMGQLKSVRKMKIAEKKMYMHESEFEMLEGEVLLSYDPHLRSFESQLITIRFWVECQLEFAPNIWKYTQK